MMSRPRLACAASRLTARATTGCLPTLITDRIDVIERLAAVAPASLQIPGARNAVALLGVAVAAALRMASRTPATFLGLESQLGAIAPGYRADLVIEIWVAGQPSF
jgi:N-acetylglucosamine-6-phosphate deacetylase